MYWSDNGKFAPNPTLMALFQRAHDDKMAELNAIRAAQQTQAQAALLNAQSAAALRPSQSAELMARAGLYQAQAQGIPAQSYFYKTHGNLLQAQADEANAKHNAALNADPNILNTILGDWNNTHGQLPPYGTGQQFTLGNLKQSSTGNNQQNGIALPLFDMFNPKQFPSDANLPQNLFDENNKSTVNNDKQALPSNIGIPGVQLKEQNGVSRYTNLPDTGFPSGSTIRITKDEDNE
jgi:hypothetical protein